MLKRLRVSDNQRFLVHDDGTPFFWLGDTAWELFHRCTLEDAQHYLENRRQKGFTVIQAVALAEFDGLRVPNMNGDVPFSDAAFTQPNEAYFQFVDTVIDLAAQKGLYIALLPTWGDKVTSMWGTGPVIFETTEQAEHYGEWIGQRYRHRPNIIWILGGDRPAQKDNLDYRAIWRAMAEGIQRAAGTDVVMGYHPPGGVSSSASFHDDAWLSFNMWQSGHVHLDTPNWEMITQDYERQPVKPVLDGEPNYEDHPIDPFLRQWKPEYGYYTDYDVRKQAYRAVFAGAFGHTYGHHSVWSFQQQGREPINFPLVDWRTALNRPGAAQVGILRRLMEARPFLTRIPAQDIIVSEAGERSTHVRATRCAEGRYAMVYIPNAGQAVTIDTSRLGECIAWWLNPRDGRQQIIGTIATGKHTFIPDGSGLDRVLVLDQVAQPFAGQGI